MSVYRITYGSVRTWDIGFKNVWQLTLTIDALCVEWLTKNDRPVCCDLFSIHFAYPFNRKSLFSLTMCIVVHGRHESSVFFFTPNRSSDPFPTRGPLILQICILSLLNRASIITPVCELISIFYPSFFATVLYVSVSRAAGPLTASCSRFTHLCNVPPCSAFGWKGTCGRFFFLLHAGDFDIAGIAGQKKNEIPSFSRWWPDAFVSQRMDGRGCNNDTTRRHGRPAAMTWQRPKTAGGGRSGKFISLHVVYCCCN